MIRGKDVKTAKKLYEKLDELRGKGTTMSVAFIQDGEIIAEAAAGTRDGNPDNPASTQDLYNVGSISKIYVTVALLKLVEMGKLDLDKPVVDYVPNFKMRDERYKKITSRMLLNHSSGLPGFGCHDSLGPKIRDTEWYYGVFLDYISKCYLKADPGEYAVYCNDGFTLAELVAVGASGMPYADFLKQYVFEPLDVTSTCAYSKNYDHRALVRCAAMPPEHLMVAGAGGISTDMEDLARFGYEFIEPGRVLSKESADSTGLPQKLGREYAEKFWDYGLGWDTINFKSKYCSFGDGVIAKGGGTAEFLSFLIVDRNRKISAAFSSTMDCEQRPNDCLAKLFDVFLQYAPVKSQPLPEGYAAEFAGKYYNAHSMMDVSFGEDSVTISVLTPNGPVPMGEPIPFDGKRFVKEGTKAWFVKDDRGICYFCQDRGDDDGASAMAEKPVSLPPVNEAWKKRDGKFYLNCSGSKYDYFVGEECYGIQIMCDKDSGVVGFSMGAPAEGGFSPSVAVDDFHTGMFLTAPGGSRDAGTADLWLEDGVEHIWFQGYEFVDAESAPELTAGEIKIGKEENRYFKVPAGKTFKLDGGAFRIIGIDKAFAPTGDTTVNMPVDTVSEGYVLVMSDEEGTLTVTECAKEE